MHRKVVRYGLHDTLAIPRDRIANRYSWVFASRQTRAAPKNAEILSAFTRFSHVKPSRPVSLRILLPAATRHKALQHSVARHGTRCHIPASIRHSPFYHRTQENPSSSMNGRVF